LCKDSTSDYVLLGVFTGIFVFNIGLAAFFLARELKSAKMQNNNQGLKNKITQVEST